MRLQSEKHNWKKNLKGYRLFLFLADYDYVYYIL